MNLPFTRKPEVTIEALPDGSMVLFDPHTMMAYPISSTGAIIWEACDGSHTAGQIVEDLLGIFDVSRDVVERDAGLFVANLLEIGLLIPATANQVKSL